MKKKKKSYFSNYMMIFVLNIVQTKRIINYKSLEAKRHILRRQDIT